MYELIILSFLARRPLHGYLIAKIINDMIGPYARLSNGRLYPLLAKLEADGLITAAEGAPARPGARRQRTYTITAAGRTRFHQLMMDTTSNQGDYQRIFWYKLPCLSLLALHERLYLLDHYITYCQAHIFHLTTEMEDLRQHIEEYYPDAPMQREATLYAMGHWLRAWRLELESAQRWRSQTLAAAEQTAEQTAERTDEMDTPNTTITHDQIESADPLERRGGRGDTQA